MNPRFRTSLFALVGVLASIHGAARSGGLQPLVESSGAVVVAQIETASFDGVLHHVTLHVVRSLKGTLLPGIRLAADYSPSGPKRVAHLSGLPKGDVLLAMNQDGEGSWHLSQFGPPGGGLSGAYFAIPDQALASPSLSKGTASTKVAHLMAAAAEVDSDQVARFLSVVQYGDAPDIFNSWSSSVSPRLRAAGLAGRIAAQDVGALASLGTALGEASGMDAILLASALEGYRNPDPRGVRAIGRVAMSGVAGDPQVRMSCAYALSAVHTKESVPYLMWLLDSPDSTARELAVAGLSAFVTNMRIAQDGLDMAEARDEVLNPSKQGDLTSRNAPFATGTTRAFLHFGPFKSDADEASVIGFWKSWYQQNQSQF